MVPLTRQAHELVRRVLHHGEVAIDATAGNGHDVLFLARHVGPTGRILAVDIQPDAISATQQRLDQEGIENVQLITGNHADLRRLVPGELRRVGAVMFNLGYLPGGDHNVTTVPAHVLPALDSAKSLLRPGGILTVCAYRGHSGGREEAKTVQRWMQQNGGLQVDAGSAPAAHSPVLFWMIAPADAAG